MEVDDLPTTSGSSRAITGGAGLTAPLADVGSGGVGLGYRLEVDRLIAGRVRAGTIAFSEMIAEAVPSHADDLPPAVRVMLDAGMPVVPHGVKLGLGDATPPSPERLRVLAHAVDVLGAPLVSEHVAFVRVGSQEIGHLTPVPRTRASLAVVVDNVRRTMAHLPVPLAVENAAALFDWPHNDLTEAQFLTAVLEQTDAWLLLDLANVAVTAHNTRLDPAALLGALPMERVAYVHVAGGEERDGLRHDTHTHSLWPELLDLVAELASAAPDAPVLLERDGRFPPAHALEAELDLLAAARERGRHGPATTPARERERFGEGRRTIGQQDGPSTDGELAGERTALAERHHSLTAYLVTAGPAPDGFPDAPLLAARAALRQKRRGEVAGRLPALAAALGPTFAVEFDRYADRFPPPSHTGTDVGAFVEALRRHIPSSTLNEAAAEEMLHTVADVDPGRRRLRRLTSVALVRQQHRSGTVWLWRWRSGSRVHVIHR